MDTDILKNPYFIGSVFIILQHFANKLISYFETKLKPKDPRINGISFFISCFVWLALVSVCGYFFINNNVSAFIVISLLLSCVFCFSVWKMLNQYWQLGIISADFHTAQGLDYDTSLSLCHSRLSFLGIGGSKLTRSYGFENALLRCNQDKPIRFLLLNPNDKTLVSAARRAGKDSQQYLKQVVNSLKKLKEIKENREVNIQVKFYKGRPLFRLMFLDNSLCLFGGYTKIGVDDGSQLPQVHLLNKYDQRDTTCLYSTLEKYYEDLWEKSEDWDFQKHLV